MENIISLKIKDSEISPHNGYGAGSGYLIQEEYVCPCGKGTVHYEKDDIPGFRDSSAYVDCAECDGKYSYERRIAYVKK